MAKIVRKTQKIFASSAGVNQIAQYGSLAAAAPAFTTDPAVIQSLANYLGGWFSAVIGSNSPAIEDMNAIQYLYAYQLAYLMQEGIAEWDAGTTYYIGSIVSDGIGLTYISKIDNNLNSPITSNDWLPMNGLTKNAAASLTLTIPSGYSLTNPNLVIPTGAVWTVQSGGALYGVDSITLQGTASLTIQSGGKGRVI